MTITSDPLIKKVVDIMDKNTNTFKESLEYYQELKKEMIQIQDTQIEILKILKELKYKNEVR